MNLLTKSCDVLHNTENDVQQFNSNITDIYLKSKNQEIVYRKNKKTIDKIHEFDSQTNAKIKTTHYDYFNDKKIRAIDEYDTTSGKIIRTTNFVLYKSVDEYDLQTGRKIRTINYDMKDSDKIASIQEYDSEFEKVIKISVFKKDGKAISIVKEINPQAEETFQWQNCKDGEEKAKIAYERQNYSPVNLIPDELKNNEVNIPNFDYDSIKQSESEDSGHMAKLIDNLYKDKSKFEVKELFKD